MHLPCIWSCLQEPYPLWRRRWQKVGAQIEWCCSVETFSWNTQSHKSVNGFKYFLHHWNNILSKSKSLHCNLGQFHVGFGQCDEWLKALLVPSMLCYNHLCSNAVKGLPEISVLQGHPDAALLVWVSCWGGPGHAQIHFGVCRENTWKQICKVRCIYKTYDWFVAVYRVNRCIRTRKNIFSQRMQNLTHHIIDQDSFGQIVPIYLHPKMNKPLQSSITF